MKCAATAVRRRLYHHVPIMPGEAVRAWAGDAPAHTPTHFVDATTGGGGHSALLLQRLPAARLLCLDRDADAIAHASRVLAPWADRVTLRHLSYAHLEAAIESAGWARIGLNGILLDCGLSSHQLDTASRGFSVRGSLDGPLDMRFDASSGSSSGGASTSVTAGDLISHLPEAELARIFREYGEEPAASTIARAVVRARGERGGLITTTGQLAALVSAAVGFRERQSRRHPATRVFQALRIAVNDELEGLASVLRTAPRLLGPGGRLAVLTFHSLEDRLVKRIAGALLEDAAGGPACPSHAELQGNTRARSAKLRCFRRAAAAGPG